VVVVVVGVVERRRIETTLGESRISVAGRDNQSDSQVWLVPSTNEKPLDLVSNAN
jgi:hypothetical protein